MITAKKARGMKVTTILALTALCVVACQYLVPVASPIQQPAATTPAPKTVDVYYSEELVQQRCSTGKGYIFDTYTFEIGSQSVAMLNTIFSSLFQNINRIDSDPSKSAHINAHESIAVRLADFTGCEASWPIYGTTTIKIAYEVTIRSGTGREIAHFESQGQADQYDVSAGTRGGYIPEASYLGRLTEAAMRKAGANIIFEFERLPEIRGELHDARYVRTVPS